MRHTLYTGTQEAPAGTRHKLVTRRQTHMYWLPGRQHKIRHTGLHADTHEQADKSEDEGEAQVKPLVSRSNLYKTQTNVASFLHSNIMDFVTAHSGFPRYPVSSVITSLLVSWMPSVGYFLLILGVHIIPYPHHSIASMGLLF